MDLPGRFNNVIKTANLFSEKDWLLLAVSGGVDSIVLCELCKQAGYDFTIAHCNFQLRGEDSNRDEAFVRKLGSRYGVRVLVKQYVTTGSKSWLQLVNLAEAIFQNVSGCY
jgi:tRNA(Ile)-lysidine synthase